MYRKILFCIISSQVFFSCINQVPDESASEELNTGEDESCYRYIQNNDTIILTTRHSKGRISGTLLYNLYQKDKNTGTLQGKMNGNILLAEYTFHSEGTESIRPIAFKKEGDTFIEGYGETAIKNGRETFIHPDSLAFTRSIILKRYDCKE